MSACNLDGPATLQVIRGWARERSLALHLVDESLGIHQFVRRSPEATGDMTREEMTDFDWTVSIGEGQAFFRVGQGTKEFATEFVQMERTALLQGLGRLYETWRGCVRAIENEEQMAERVSEAVTKLASVVGRCCGEYQGFGGFRGHSPTWSLQRDAVGDLLAARDVADADARTMEPWPEGSDAVIFEVVEEHVTQILKAAESIGRIHDMLDKRLPRPVAAE